MNRDVAFFVKGQTFFKAIAPLICLAHKMGIKAHVFAYVSRPGKRYDDVKEATLDAIIQATKKLNPSKNLIKKHWVQNDADALRILKLNKIKNVVCQDAQHHYAFLLGHVKTFSISVFTDTPHWVQTIYKEGLKLPDWTYFESQRIHNKTVELLGFEWPGICLGSPFYDHALWMLDCNAAPMQHAVLMWPPKGLVKPELMAELNDLSLHCRDVRKVPLLVMAKSRHVIDRNLVGAFIIEYEEAGLPYSSLQVILATSLHINAYSISAFESSYFGRPALNLDIVDGLSYGNMMVKKYGFDDVYDTNLCKTIASGLIESFEEMIDVKQAPKRELTFTNNNSIDILSDMIERLE